jgi:hypothetical protein
MPTAVRWRSRSPRVKRTIPVDQRDILLNVAWPKIGAFAGATAQFSDDPSRSGSHPLPTVVEIRRFLPVLRCEISRVDG